MYSEELEESEIVIDVPFGFPINNIISSKELTFSRLSAQYCCTYFKTSKCTLPTTIV